MTNEAQIKALAALDGFTSVMNSQGFGWIGIPPLPPPVGHQGLPNYLTSYDAIIPLIQKCISWPGFKNEFHCGFNYNKFSIAEVFTATPPQLCEALLRATGKWTE